MELILELVLTPIWHAAVAVLRFAFWMCCWAIWLPASGVIWLLERLRSLFRSDVN